MKNQKNRQSMRKAIIIISFLLFPVTFIYLSPYVAIIAPISAGIINGSLIMFTIMFLMSLIFGRIWCSWFCPGAGLQEISSIVNQKKAKNGHTNWIKWFFWIPWLFTIITIIVIRLLNNKFIKIDFFYKTVNGVSGVHLTNFAERIVPFIIYYAVLALFFIMPLIFGKRAFCHYICWMAPFMILGRKISNILKIPKLKLVINNDNCTNCMLCNQKCVMSLDVNKMVKNKKLENSECILCGECVDICAKNVIKYTFKSGI